MTLREKLMHYTHDLNCGADLKQEAIATIEHIAQYIDEDDLLHHSRPLALAYLALTEDASVPVVRCKDCKHLVAVNVNGKGIPTCRMSGMEVAPAEFCSRGEKERRC
jgi:hypothetical protein